MMMWGRHHCSWSFPIVQSERKICGARRGQVKQRNCRSVRCELDIPVKGWQLRFPAVAPSPLELETILLIIIQQILNTRCRKGVGGGAAYTSLTHTLSNLTASSWSYAPFPLCYLVIQIKWRVCYLANDVLISSFCWEGGDAGSDTLPRPPR